MNTPVEDRKGIKYTTAQIPIEPQLQATPDALKLAILYNLTGNDITYFNKFSPDQLSAAAIRIYNNLAASDDLVSTIKGLTETSFNELYNNGHLEQNIDENKIMTYKMPLENLEDVEELMTINSITPEIIEFPLSKFSGPEKSFLENKLGVKYNQPINPNNSFEFIEPTGGYEND